jgi:hypothetical protein
MANYGAFSIPLEFHTKFADFPPLLSQKQGQESQNKWRQGWEAEFSNPVSFARRGRGVRSTTFVTSCWRCC